HRDDRQLTTQCAALARHRGRTQRDRFRRSPTGARRPVRLGQPDRDQDQGWGHEGDPYVESTRRTERTTETANATARTTPRTIRSHSGNSGRKLMNPLLHRTVVGMANTVMTTPVAPPTVMVSKSMY